MSKNNNEWANHAFDNGVELCKGIVLPLWETIKGIFKMETPAVVSTGLSALFHIGLKHYWDYSLFRLFDIEKFYPRNQNLHSLYVWIVMLFPMWVVGVVLMRTNRLKKAKMEEIYKSSGLVNGVGKTPNVLFETKLGDQRKLLQLSRNSLDFRNFEKAKSSLEGGLNAYVEEIKENTLKGSVDIVYTTKPMPEHCSYGGESSYPETFLLGENRSGRRHVDLKHTPHFLVAGETGSGKSTFLRQMINTLAKSNPEMTFTLIDLKGGLEFAVFENLTGINVAHSIDETLKYLNQVNVTLERRMDFMKAFNLRSFEEFGDKSQSQQEQMLLKQGLKEFGRHMIVVDEATEMFRPGLHASPADIQKGREILNRVARMGRSLGIHLVVATQRPDSYSLDPQIKANLTGVVCFKMENDASSITVLGNGAATNLPNVKGRAYFKEGGSMTEIQTPWLTEAAVVSGTCRRRPKEPLVEAVEPKATSSVNRLRPIEPVQKERFE